VASNNGDSVLKKVVSLSDVAALTVQSERSVQRLVKSGVLRLARDRQGRQLKGRFVLGESVPRVCEHLRDQATADDPHERLYAQSRARRMRCAAEAAALDLKLKKGELLEGALVDLEVSTILRSLRDNLRGIPAQLMHPLRAMNDLAQIRQTLASAIDAVLTKTADGDLSAKLRRELRRRHQVLERKRDDGDEQPAE